MRILPLALTLAACAPGTVVTVQPGAVDKTALDGEWYWRRTVDDVPYGTPATFAGAQGQLERIVWEVQQDLLLGYRSYPHVDGDGAIDSAPLLAFPIVDQFDIRRGYDRATGEESNVVEENRENPWYDRQYIRVDWSANLAEIASPFAAVPLSVLDWVTTDDRADDAPQFDDSDGDGTIDSLYLTQRALVEPDTVELPGYGDVPTCVFFGEAEHECGAVEIGVVSSFVRVGDRAPVQGLPYDDHLMETFGFFSTERLAWDEGYGITEPTRVRYANRHPLWERTIATDGGAPLCEAGGAVGRCDTFRVEDQPQVVQIPVAERVPRPIVYHAGPDFPADLLPVMTEVEAEWNGPLVAAVHGEQYWACIDGGGKPKECEDALDRDLVMFQFCPNNPSLATDPPACSTDHTGPEGRPDGVPDPIRVGDLRYHLAQIVPNPQISSPFGYGPSAADPVGGKVALADGELALGAGEIVSGNAFVYEYVLDRVAHQVADLVQLLNGEISTEAFVDGEDVSAWVTAVRGGDVGALAGSTAGVDSAWTERQVRDRLSLVSNGFAPLVPTVRPDPTDVDGFLDAVGDAVDRSGAFGAGAAETAAGFAALTASPFDDLAWTPETTLGLGFDPATAASDPSLAGASPFDLIDPLEAAAREQWRVLAGQNAVDLDPYGEAAAGFVDSSLVGLARDYASRGLSYDEIVADVRTNTFREVMLHEVGHTLGLRHNFAGSYDAFNFRPEYWELRDDGEMGPRHVDPPTPAEVNGQIDAFAYSTVMDYPAARNSGWAGLGHYDHAAIKFGYSGLVEVLTGVPEADAVSGLPNATGIAFMSAYASSNVLPSVLLNYSNGAFLDLHYTDFPAIAGDFEARLDVPYGRLVGSIGEGGAFADGLVVETGGGGAPVGAPAVPYRFCSDEFAIGMTCARFDQGADPYEIQSFLMERYWNDYVLTNFARQRYGYGNAAAYVSRLEDRVFEPLRVWQRYYALFHGIFDVANDPYAQEFFASDRGWGGWTAGTDSTFRFLTQVITRPEAGEHATVTRADGVEVLAPTFGGLDQVPLVEGAYFESEWDSSSGYFWFERQTRIGTYWDRMLALYSLSNTVPYDFLGYDTAADPRQYAIGFQDIYRDPVAVFLGRLMADDVGALAPVRQADGSLVYPDPMRPEVALPAGERVAPATFWLVRFDADAFGLSLLDHGYDRSFLNHARIYVEGTGDAPDPGPDQAVVQFTDPYSGRTFTAWSFPQIDAAGAVRVDAAGEGVELSSSARMLRKANLLADRCGDPGLPADQTAAACAELERYTADLDLHLEMFAAFDQ
ncbi:MAG: zinc-dependent metalloprotease [Myxococcota bacterium]